MAKASPTRMNLLSRKSQLELSREGIQLLKQKRDVLMAEFVKLVRPLMDRHITALIQLVLWTVLAVCGLPL